MIATGAGAASRWAIGTALFGGLLVATVLSFLIVPVLYVVIKSLEAHFLGTKPPSSLDGGSSGNGVSPHPDGSDLSSANGHSTPGETENPVPTPFQEGENPA